MSGSRDVSPLLLVVVVVEADMGLSPPGDVSPPPLVEADMGSWRSHRWSIGQWQAVPKLTRFHGGGQDQDPEGAEPGPLFLC